jgi:pentose-5-phosphate-3-epimerase
MQYQPSILEYSTVELQRKLDILNNMDFNSVLLQEIPTLHLDLVLEYFAKQRSIMQSLDFETLHSQLKNTFKNRPLVLTIHLMGEAEDLRDIYEVLEKFEFVKKWKYIIFVPAKYLSLFENLQAKNIRFGVWYDLNEWEVTESIKTPVLLMTVPAGISGQKLTIENKNKAIEYTKFNNNYILLDGGWKLGDEFPSQQTDIITYTSFWDKYS